jgi:hypothetical protein
MNDEYETTRSYPRTLTEAFPHAPEPTFHETVTNWHQTIFIAALFFCWGFIVAVLIM